jgi:hypothetical protein
MLAYLALEKASEDSMTSTSDNSASMAVKIEKMAKQFKTHQSTLDFNLSFIKSTVLTTSF